MRLLNVESFKLEQFYSDIPRYAILSHTWGKDEVTFDEFPTLKRTRPRLSKAVRCCEVAKSFCLGYVWIDTFCINKDSSAELSESINSMYRWYQDAVLCFAYLSDVEGYDVGERSAFRKSRWFTRGWTLQELVAPKNLVFLDSNWKPIGRRGSQWYYTERDNDVKTSTIIARSSAEDGFRRDVSTAVHQVTGISAQYLEIRGGGHINKATVAEKMSWAAKRQTTRPEDMAYSLLGIFSISMPLLYGEGGERALVRLQEEITKQSHDLTIFAWGFGIGPTKGGIFATSPADFEGCGRVAWSCPKTPARRSHYTVTNLGVQITARYVPGGERVCYVLLDTVSTGDDIMAIPMTRSGDQDDILERSAGSIPLLVPCDWLAEAQSQQVYLAEYPVILRHEIWYRIWLIQDLSDRGYRIAEVYPPHVGIGEMKEGQCDITDREGVVIIRYTKDGSDQICIGLYKFCGRWRCRLLRCSPTTTVAGMLVGTIKESYAQGLLEKWDPVVTLDGRDVGTMLWGGNYENPPDGDGLKMIPVVGVELYEPIPSGPG